MKQCSLKCVACCLLGVALTFSIASAMDECKTASPALMGESKTNDRLAQLLPPTRERLQDELYTVLDPMPLDLIKIIAGYYIINTIKTPNKAPILFVCPIGKNLLALGLPNSIEIVNPETGEFLRTIKVADLKALFGLTKNRLIAVGSGAVSGNNEIKLFDGLNDFALRRQYPFGRERFFNENSVVKLRAKSHSFLIGLSLVSKSKIQIINLYPENPTVERELVDVSHDGDYICLKKVPGKKRIAALSMDYTLKFWNYATGKQKGPAAIQVAKPFWPSEIPSNDTEDYYTITGGYRMPDQIVEITDSFGEVYRSPVDYQTSSFRSRPDLILLSNNLIASRDSYDGSLRLFDCSTGKELNVYNNKGKLFCGLSDGRLLLQNPNGNDIELFDPRNSEQKRNIITDYKDSIGCVCCLHKGLVTSSKDELKLWM